MTIFLETKRLLIRESSLDNFENAFALFTDKDVMQYVGHGVKTREETHELIAKTVLHYQKHGFGFGDVYEKDTCYYIGRAGLSYIELDEKAEIEVGYVLHKDHWRKGYATELSQALIQWGFNQLALNKIVAVLNPHNDASRRVLEKSGMCYVGRAFHYRQEVAKYEIINYPVNSRLLECVPASTTDYPIIQNMARFYLYDMSQYLGNKMDWKIPENGLYEALDFKSHWEDKQAHPFLIRYKGELAGFAIVDKKGSMSDIDFNMAQFFVLKKFSGKGVGSTIARQLFDWFKGNWEIMAMSGNEGAYRFWRKVISDYSEQNFIEYSTQDNGCIKNYLKFASRK
jgi:[ribosomal protein S5]-alanine N-acetyltransferase